MGGVAGRTGVLLFFTISCVLYLHNHNVKNGSLGSVRYLFKKLKSVYPHVILSESIMLILYFFSNNKENLLFKYLLHAVMIQSYIPESVTKYCYCLNEPLWYLSMMISIWLVLPIMKERKNNHLLISSFVLVAYLAISLMVIRNNDILRYFTYVCPLFWILILLVIHDFNGIYLANKKALHASIFFVIVVFVLSVMIPSYLYVVLLFVPCFIIVKSIVVLYESKSTNKGSIIAKSLSYVGRYSKYIYFYHFILCFIIRDLYMK